MAAQPHADGRGKNSTSPRGAGKRTALRRGLNAECRTRYPVPESVGDSNAHRAGHGLSNNARVRIAGGDHLP